MPPQQQQPVPTPTAATGESAKPSTDKKSAIDADDIRFVLAVCENAADLPQTATELRTLMHGKGRNFHIVSVDPAAANAADAAAAPASGLWRTGKVLIGLWDAQSARAFAKLELQGFGSTSLTVQNMRSAGHLTVRAHTHGKSWQLEVEPTELISDVKLKIQDHDQKLSRGEQRLAFGGKVLPAEDDSRTLESCEIPVGSTVELLYLARRMRGEYVPGGTFIFVVLPQNSVPDRSVISLHVELTITVGEVKNMIHVNEGLDPEDLALQRAGGGVLDDSATLEDSHVGHETTLTAVYT